MLQHHRIPTAAANTCYTTQRRLPWDLERAAVGEHRVRPLPFLDHLLHFRRLSAAFPPPSTAFPLPFTADLTALQVRHGAAGLAEQGRAERRPAGRIGRQVNPGGTHPNGSEPGGSVQCYCKRLLQPGPRSIPADHLKALESDPAFAAAEHIQGVHYPCARDEPAQVRTHRELALCSQHTSLKNSGGKVD